MKDKNSPAYLLAAAATAAIASQTLGPQAAAEESRPANKYSPLTQFDFVSDDDLTLQDLFGPPAPTDYIVVNGDTIRFHFAANIRGQLLTEHDFQEVAANLDVEVAAIKAIVEIETGRTGNGFNPDGSPVINFDLNIFRNMAAKRKIKLAEYAKSHPLVFERPDARRFGSQQQAQHARLSQALEIDRVAAIQSTFWGMFQIGGFNWKRCGTSSPDEFADIVSRNERDQLDLFAEFVRNSGLLSHLQTKNWAAFARLYNGPSYASRGYHTRMAKAYKKYSTDQG